MGPIVAFIPMNVTEPEHSVIAMEPNITKEYGTKQAKNTIISDYVKLLKSLMN